MPTGQNVLSSTRIWEDDDVDVRNRGTTSAKHRRRLQPLSEDEDLQCGSLMMADFPQLSSIAPPESHYSGTSDEASQVYSDDGEAIVTEGESDGVHPENSVPTDQGNERTAAGADEDVDIDVLNRLRKLSKGAAKRIVKNPRPKLDTIRLLGDRGLPALLSDFKKVKFKGKGHEFTDLDKLLFTYKAWAHRLIPKHNFAEVVDRLEKLGTRREVHVTLHRLREGVWPPTRSDEFVHDSHSGSDDDANLTTVDGRLTNPEAAWNVALATSPTNVKINGSQSTRLDSPVLAPLADLSNQDQISEPGSSWQSSASVTADAVERAERNRRLALQRLASRRFSGSSTVGDPLSCLKAAFKASQLSSANSSNQDKQQSLGRMDVNSGSQCPVEIPVSVRFSPQSPDAPEGVDEDMSDGNSPRPLQIQLSPLSL